MDTQEALAQLGITPDSLTAEQRRKLDEDGYFIAENVFSPAEVAEMRSEIDRLSHRGRIRGPRGPYRARSAAPFEPVQQVTGL